MVSLSQAKALGGVGAILVFIPAVSIIGYIMVLVAVKEISDTLNDKAIFSNMILAVAAGIIGAVAVVFVVFFRVMLAGRTLAHPGLAIVGGLVLAWVFLIVSAVFLRRSYNEISKRLGVGMFRTSATLYLVGAALTIVLVGFLLLFIGQILQAVAFFSIPSELPVGGSMPGPSGPVGQGPPSMAVPASGSKYCPSCGAQLSANATFCDKCGAKQP